MHASGGKLTLSACELTQNWADARGGALYVGVGTVILSSGTLLHDNHAPEGSSYYFLATNEDGDVGTQLIHAPA